MRLPSEVEYLERLDDGSERSWMVLGYVVLSEDGYMVRDCYVVEATDEDGRVLDERAFFRRVGRAEESVLLDRLEERAGE